MKGRKKQPRLKKISHLLPWLIVTLIIIRGVVVKFWQQFLTIFKINQIKKGFQKRRFLSTAIATFWITLFLSSINFLLPPSALASASLSIEPLTWDFIGLDSNQPTTKGPDRFLIGARVCNLSTTEAAQNVTIRFVREGATNNFINISTTGLDNDQWLVPAIPPSATGIPPLNHHKQTSRPNNCFDAYYIATIQRTSSSFDTVQRYRIEAFADNAAIVDTNSYPDPYQGTVNEYDTGHPRQLYVERLIEQERNDVISFNPITVAGLDTANLVNGKYEVTIGGTYAFELITTTSTAYPQLTVSSDFPNSIFQIVDVQTDYSNVSGDPDNSSIYANACGWISDPTATGYHTSSNNCEYDALPGGTPDQYPRVGGEGKVGNTVKTRYVLKILDGSGDYDVNHLILDYSGSSYHYNADYGSNLGVVTFRIVTADLAINKSHTDTFTRNSQKTYTVSVTNNPASLSSATGITVTDSLPDGLYYVSGTGTNWTCDTVSFTEPGPPSPDLRDIQCSYSATLIPGATTEILTITVYVQSTAPNSFTNSVTVSAKEFDPDTSNNIDSDLTVIVAPKLILLKRITGVYRDSVSINPLGGQPFDQFNEDGITDNNDNDILWPEPKSVYLQGAIDGGQVAPQDEVEYTIYFMNTGNTGSINMSICDVIPEHMMYVNNSIQLFLDTIAPLENPPTTLINYTDVIGDDLGSFYQPFIQPPTVCKDPNNPSQSLSSVNNNTGTVVVNVVSGNDTLPNADNPGNPSNSYGFIRFRAKVN
jgi:uncharacterized repeat protein (TIGR01451 family)